MIKEIEHSKYTFITAIHEPEDNSLEFNLVCGIEASEPSEISIGAVRLGQATKILPDKSKRYKVYFECYIGYNVLDESYINKLGTSYTGINPRLYQESLFLKYINEQTFATSDYPGKFSHYTFLGEHHILNVVSHCQPEITPIN